MPVETQADDACVDAYALLAAGGYIGTMTVLAQREVLQNLGGMDVTLRRSEDTDLWLRLARIQRKLVYIESPIAKYHVLAGQKSYQHDYSRAGLVIMPVSAQTHDGN